MRIDLYGSTEAKLEDVMEHLAIRYSLEDLLPEELLDALLEIAVDSVVTDQPTIPAVRDAIVSMCSKKMALRG